MRKLSVLIFLLAASSVFLLLRAFSVKPSGEHKEHIKTLTLLIPDDLDSSRTISYNSILLIDNLFSRLFRINENLQFEGEIAKSWNIDKNKKIINIAIVKDARFSDGSLIKATDVVASIKRAISPESLPAFFFKNILKVESNGDYEISVFYQGWDSVVLNQLGSPFLPIYKSGVPPRRSEDNTWITSSRYSIKNWNVDELSLNVNGKSVKTLTVLPLEQVKSKLSSMDLMISRLNWISTDTIQKEIAEYFTTYIFDSFNTSLVMSNIKSDPEYRKCLTAKSLQDEKLSLIIGDARIKSILPPSMFSYDSKLLLPTIKRPNISKAFKIIVQRPDNLVKSVLERLQTIGLSCNMKIELEDLDNTTYIKRLINHDFDFAYVTISVLYNDPFFVFSFFHQDSKFNFTGSTKKLSSQIDLYTKVANQQQAIDQSHGIQQLIISEGLAIPLLTVKSMSFVRKPLSLKGHSLFDVMRWEDVL